jgi:type II restriction enzyme
LKKRHTQDRQMQRIPVTIAAGKTINLSPGGQNALVEQIIREFAERFVPGGKLLYVRDTETKFAYVDAEAQRALGVDLEAHGKMPDVIIYDERRNLLVLIEAVSSHGPIGPKRHAELTQAFSESQAGLVFVTAFSDRETMKTYLADILWETEVWIAESPAHHIHFDGERLLGPYQKQL